MGNGGGKGTREDLRFITSLIFAFPAAHACNGRYVEGLQTEWEPSACWKPGCGEEQTGG